MIKCSSHPDETDPDIPRETDRWIWGRVCRICGVDVTEDHQLCRSCATMVHAQTARRMTPRRKAQRQRKQLQRLLVELKCPMPEAERRRIWRVKVWTL